MNAGLAIRIVLGLGWLGFEVARGEHQKFSVCKPRALAREDTSILFA